MFTVCVDTTFSVSCIFNPWHTTTNDRLFGSTTAVMFDIVTHPPGKEKEKKTNTQHKRNGIWVNGLGKAGKKTVPKWKISRIEYDGNEHTVFDTRENERKKNNIKNWKAFFSNGKRSCCGRKKAIFRDNEKRRARETERERESERGI